MSSDAAAARALQEFRQRLYACLGQRADALFELTDAMLTGGDVASPPHLSLTPTHRRGWGSLYAALREGTIDEESLHRLLARYPLVDDHPQDAPRVYAVDVSPWPRCEARTSPERSYLYHASRHSGGKPVVAGWAYQLVTEIGFVRDSWTAPVDARRVRPHENANDIAAGQVAALAGRVSEAEASPLFVFDAGYDPVRLTQRLSNCRTQILVRLGCNRSFYFDPEPEPGKRPAGRPPTHGAKFDLEDSSTWPEPYCEHRCEDSGYGAIRVRSWSKLHPKTRHAKERYGSETAAIVRGTVVLVEVERLPCGEKRGMPKALWLWWHGEGEPDLDLIWRAYLRRFDMEHMIRHWKQQLGWTTPRVRHPEQADRWTWLILAAYTQLRLARLIVCDRRLPWEKPLAASKLTPHRVLRGFATVLPVVGTPAKAPKPRGQPPGRPKGRLSERARRYPPIKKAA